MSCMSAATAVLPTWPTHTRAPAGVPSPLTWPTHTRTRADPSLRHACSLVVLHSDGRPPPCSTPGRQVGVLCGGRADRANVGRDRGGDARPVGALEAGVRHTQGRGRWRQQDAQNRWQGAADHSLTRPRDPAA
eukprot:5952278-Prymnesium_polylepis.2